MGIHIAVGEVDGTSLDLLAAKQGFYSRSRVRLADFLAGSIVYSELPELGFDGHWFYPGMKIARSRLSNAQ
jgi:hypothetical protein